MARRWLPVGTNTGLAGALLLENTHYLAEEHVKVCPKVDLRTGGKYLG